MPDEAEALRTLTLKAPIDEDLRDRLRDLQRRKQGVGRAVRATAPALEKGELKYPNPSPMRKFPLCLPTRCL